MNSPKKKWLSRAANVILFALLAGILLSPSFKAWTMRLMMKTGLFDAKIEKVGPGKMAPAFRYSDAFGLSHSSEALRGKVVFINFWATWCPPCVAEMPSLNRLYKNFINEKDVAFLFLNEDDDPAKARDFLIKKGYQLPLSFRVGEIAPELFKGSLPTTVVLDKKGAIVLHHTGMADFNSAQFEKQLKALMASQYP